MHEAEHAAPEQRADEEVEQQSCNRLVHADRLGHQRDRLMQRRHHQRGDETRNDAVADPVSDGDVGTHRHAIACTDT